MGFGNCNYFMMKNNGALYFWKISLPLSFSTIIYIYNLNKVTYSFSNSISFKTKKEFEEEYPNI